MKWAVSQEVDIISISWAIEPLEDCKDKRGIAPHDALTLATERNILLFYAHPDTAPELTVNTTSPKQLVAAETLFCIGAAMEDGQRRCKIDKTDDLCDL
ncbi:uncharacterized protein B0H64DRAFT_399895 [Chaetomium fimeti]|uniref:Uncharacterized protein n=1 Tax=Chaetomium fimeti TaxID=1854472 RepID=A0AAE0HEG3_9PEZI|nr:hypothetical protein B0H64DRAFT_399895 [Chaetomium fimeti]